MFDAGSRVVQHHQLVRTRIRQRLEQHALDHAENGRIRADADGERETATLVNTGSCRSRRRMWWRRISVVKTAPAAQSSVSCRHGEPGTRRGRHGRGAMYGDAIARTGGRWRVVGPVACCRTPTSSVSHRGPGMRTRGGTEARRIRSRSLSSPGSRRDCWREVQAARMRLTVWRRCPRHSSDPRHDDRRRSWVRALLAVRSHALLRPVASDSGRADWAWRFCRFTALIVAMSELVLFFPLFVFALLLRTAHIRRSASAPSRVARRRVADRVDRSGRAKPSSRRSFETGPIRAADSRNRISAASPKASRRPGRVSNSAHRSRKAGCIRRRASRQRT